jgi:hypothetical protein
MFTTIRLPLKLRKPRNIPKGIARRPAKKTPIRETVRDKRVIETSSGSRERISLVASDKDSRSAPNSNPPDIYCVGA